MASASSPTSNMNVEETNKRKEKFIEKLKGHDVKMRFSKAFTVFYMTNPDMPVQGIYWEHMKCKILNKFCDITDQANGGHKSGKDNKVDDFNMSDKTTRIDNKNTLNVSSYRLTKVTDMKNPGNKNDILREIEKRDNTFDYFSILVKRDNYNSITYEWYVIPKDYYLFKIDPNDFSEKFGKQGKNKDNIIGWKWKYGEITFSMSSQIWYSFDINCIKQFRIHSIKLNHNLPTIDCEELYKLITDNGYVIENE
tara:strand:- start:258 stop:1013 length:756 start_codon:yes stop_codon:yes gene_type:complete